MDKHTHTREVLGGGAVCVQNRDSAMDDSRSNNQNLWCRQCGHGQHPASWSSMGAIVAELFMHPPIDDGSLVGRSVHGKMLVQPFISWCVALPCSFSLVVRVEIITKLPNQPTISCRFCISSSPAEELQKAARSRNRYDMTRHTRKTYRYTLRSTNKKRAYRQEKGRRERNDF